MTRRELRENVFNMLFRVEFHDEGEMTGQLGMMEDEVENIKEEDAASDLASPSGETVSCNGGHSHLKNDNRHNQNKAVPKFQQILRAHYKTCFILRKADLVGDEL